MHVLTLLLSALLIFITSLTIPTNVAAATCVTSPLWGEDGELWDPNGPLRDWSTVGYHHGNAPIPYQQGPAVLSFGPGRHEITERILLTHGVLRGAGMDATTLYFPQSLSAMGVACPWGRTGATCWDWAGGVIQLGPGTEIGLEDLTVEFPAHHYTHHKGRGFNGPDLWECTHCWIKGVRVINSDEGFSIHGGAQNTIEDVEVFANDEQAHTYISLTTSTRNLVQRMRVYHSAIHGLAGNWGSSDSVYANGWGEPMRIEPNHNGPTTTGMLYSNLQGIRSHKAKMSDTRLWNFMHTNLCPLDLYTAQLQKRLGGQP